MTTTTTKGPHTMTTNPNPSTEVVGRALYLEATRTYSSVSYTMQMLLVPEVQIATDAVVHMSMYRRRISTAEPRKTWRHFSSPTNVKRIDASGVSSITTPVPHALNMIHFAKSTLGSLLDEGNNYRLVGVPVVVEVTRADIDDVRLGKTPYKILGRVWKCRKKLGFPEHFLPAS